MTTINILLCCVEVLSLFVYNNLFSADTLELRSDTGIISHWKDYQKLAPYTYLSYQSSAPFTRADSSIVHVPMIPQTGSFKIGNVPQLKCLAAEFMFEVIYLFIYKIQSR